jgi:hypothetical protein
MKAVQAQNAILHRDQCPSNCLWPVHNRTKLIILIDILSFTLCKILKYYFIPQKDKKKVGLFTALFIFLFHPSNIFVSAFV